MDLAELQAGWFNGEGKAFDKVKLQELSDLLDKCGDINVDGVSPALDGKVSLEWFDEVRHMRLAIDLDHMTGELSSTDLCNPTCNKKILIDLRDAAWRACLKAYVPAFFAAPITYVDHTLEDESK